MDSRRKIFRTCFSCLVSQNLDENPEQYIKTHFGGQYSEYEYIIQNSEIIPVPKAILDEISVEKPKNRRKKINIFDLIRNRRHRDRTTEASCSKPDTEHNMQVEYHPAEPNPPNSIEEKWKKTKMLDTKLPLDKHYNPCYLHLCPDKTICRECKSGSENKDDILKRMLLPPAQRSAQQNSPNTQVL